MKILFVIVLISALNQSIYCQLSPRCKAFIEAEKTLEEELKRAQSSGYVRSFPEQWLYFKFDEEKPSAFYWLKYRENKLKMLKC